MSVSEAASLVVEGVDLAAAGTAEEGPKELKGKALFGWAKVEEAMVDSKSIGGNSSRSLSSKLTSVVRPPPGRFSSISILSMCVKAAAVAGRWWNPPKTTGIWPVVFMPDGIWGCSGVTRIEVGSSN